MTGYGFYASVRFLGFVGLVFLGSLIGFSYFIYSELSTEARFRHTYGANWQEEYEQVRGPLSLARAKMGVTAAGMVAECGLMVWLLRQIRPGALAAGGGRKQKGGGRGVSQLERATRQRRNAVLGIYFGLAAILVGVLLVVFRVGIFLRHANEMALGVFVFLAGYASVIAGCSNWLKAKSQNDAIVFIGLMPLVIPMIPFVRLILFAAPGLISVAMVMMPLILIVIVAVLPDKSGGAGRKPYWETRRTGTDRPDGAGTEKDFGAPGRPDGT